MSRTVKLYLGLALLIVLITGVLSWPALLKFGAQRCLQDLQKSGVRISWSGLSTTHSRVYLESLSLWVPGPLIRGSVRALVSIDSQNTSLKLKPTSLLAFSPVISFTTQAYNGILSGELLPFNPTAAINSTATNVQLGLHPQLSALGLRGGMLSGKLTGLPLSSDVPKRVSFDMNLEHLSLPSQIPGLPLAGTSFGEINLSVVGTLTPAELSFVRIQTKSDLLAVEGSGTVRSPFANERTFKGSCTVSLSDSGLAMFGTWLPTITGGVVTSSSRVFTVGVFSAPCSSNPPFGREVPINGGCLTLSYSLK